MKRYLDEYLESIGLPREKARKVALDRGDLLDMRPFNIQAREQWVNDVVTDVAQVCHDEDIALGSTLIEVTIHLTTMVSHLPPAESASLLELRRFGYIQELNRQFLHPLGLSLITAEARNGKGDLLFSRLVGFADLRDDREAGLFYSDEQISKPDVAAKARRVRQEQSDRGQLRMRFHGWVIQPVSDPVESSRSNGWH